jgi:pimeloyl-ACP methyl ester carboxylesterase
MFAALARQLKFDRVNILGSSLGGSMAMALAEKYPELTKTLIVLGGFSELDRALETNFRLRQKIIAKLGMGEEIADFMGLSTMTREFMETDAGLEVMRANQANVRNNSPELYNALPQLDPMVGPALARPREGTALHHAAAKHQMPDVSDRRRQ